MKFVFPTRRFPVNVLQINCLLKQRDHHHDMDNVCKHAHRQLAGACWDRPSISIATVERAIG